MILHGDALETLRTLESDSVQCVVTSPPYWGLRDYGTAQWDGGDPECDHNVRRWDGPKQTQGAQSGHAALSDKLAREVCKCGARRLDQQMGLESTPEEHVAAMVAVFDEVRRVLRPDGVLWLNYGDCYAQNTIRHRRHEMEWDDGRRKGAFGQSADGLIDDSYSTAVSGLKPKDLVGMPWMVAFALRAAGWWLRCDVIWHKPNPMPESVTDRPTKSHEYVFLLTKQARYFYDAHAVREEGRDWGTRDRKPGSAFVDGTPGRSRQSGGMNCNFVENGRNLRSVWTIPTQAFPEGHFATYPEELAAKCILAGTSEYGACAACGTPWRRVVEREGVALQKYYSGAGQHGRRMMRNGQFVSSSTTTGWQPACACGTDERRPCVVLDPFCGSGTTGLVALRYGRDFIGCELNAEYIEIAERRMAAAKAQPLLLTL